MDDDITTADALLAPLVGEEVVQFRMRGGTLSLGISEATLTVSPHPACESWQVRGPREDA